MRMHFGENSRMALETVRDHKTRSFLTVLGVVIGVAAMIFVASILVGVSRDIQGFLEDYGTNTLFIFRWDIAIRTGRMSAEERNRKPLKLDDAKAILAECPHVKNVTVEIMPRFNPDQQRPPLRVARYGTHEITNLDYSGADSAWEDVYNGHVTQGRFFSDFEDLHREDVAVIGDEIDKNFFPAHDAIGKTILVDGVSYQVIGVLEKRKGGLFKDESTDRVIKVPYASYRKHYPADDEIFIGAEAYPGYKDAAEDEIRGLLRRRRNVPFNKPDNFGISSAEAIADQFRQIMSTVALMTIVVSSIGLLVGGVGRDEHHADVGDRAHPRDWRAQSYRRPARRRGPAVPDRGHCPHRTRRIGRSNCRRSCGRCLAADLPFHADFGAHLGGGYRRADGHERRIVLWDVSRRQGVAPGSCRSAALRVEKRTQEVLWLQLRLDITLASRTGVTVVAQNQRQ